MISHEQVKNLSDRTEELRKYLNIEQKLIEIQNEEEKTFAPDLWDKPKEAEIIRKDLRTQKKWVEDFQLAKIMVSDLEDLLELYKEGDAQEEDVINQFNKAKDLIESLEFKNMLSEEGDNMSAVLQITSGAGGTESCDWASMLMRMYLMWGEKHGYKI